MYSANVDQSGSIGKPLNQDFQTPSGKMIYSKYFPFVLPSHEKMTIQYMNQLPTDQSADSSSGPIWQLII